MIEYNLYEVFFIAIHLQNVVFGWFNKQTQQDGDIWYYSIQIM